MILIALSVTYSGVVFRGRSLVYSDVLGWTDHSPEREQSRGWVRPSRWTNHNLLFWANFHDPGATWGQWEPGGVFLRNSLRNGEFPLWNPFVGCGAPEMANLTEALLFPPYFLMVLLGNTALLKTLYFLLIQFASGYSLYLFLRRSHLRLPAALFGGIAIVLSGGLVQNVGSLIGQTAACFPVALLFTSWFFDAPSWRRAGVLAVAYASIALSSFPPLLIAIFGFTGSYSLTVLASRWICKDSCRVITLRQYGTAVFLAGGIVAFYYLPAILLIRASPQTTDYYRDAARVTVPPVSFFQLLSPTLTGGKEIFLQPPVKLPGHEIPYVGITIFLAALLSRPEPGRRRGPLFLLAASAAVLVFLKLIGAPPVQFIAVLPVLRNVHFAAYFGILLDFLLCILGALGIQALLDRRVTTSHRMLGCVVAASLVLIVQPLASASGAFKSPHVDQWAQRWYLLLVFTTVAIALVLSSARSPRVMITGLIVLVSLEGFANAHYPREGRWDVWQHPTPLLKHLIEASKPVRLLTFGALAANTNAAYGISQYDSLMPFNSERVHALYYRFMSSRKDFFIRGALRIPPAAVLDSANIGLLAISTWAPDLISSAGQSQLDRVDSSPSTVIFRRRTSPRYFFTRSYRLAGAPEILAALERQPSALPLLLEKPPSFSARTGVPEMRTVELRTFRPNSLELSVDAPGPGLVYCSESDMNGWTAHVNGQVTPILRANYAFRAVEVPAGRVRLELSYWPPGLTAGLAVSVVTLLLLIALVTRDRPRPTATIPPGTRPVSEPLLAVDTADGQS